jgi:hypothetical protein
VPQALRSAAAAFYDPYVGESRHRSIRISAAAAAIAVAGLFLVGLVAADVATYEALPVKVAITQVNWLVGNISVGNVSGFTVTGGHTFPEDLECEIFCPAFHHASVNAPFVVESSTFAYPWFEYVNLTIQAPGTPYSGPLDITLSLGTGSDSIPPLSAAR